IDYRKPQGNIEQDIPTIVSDDSRKPSDAKRNGQTLMYVVSALALAAPLVLGYAMARRISGPVRLVTPTLGI
ncbi:hypothetical protein, partial [Cohnella sp. GbtcB17]|uniref:hypothetical protein n=1 Tax=Cohnella sp. GbtcB17 TaxID=2824762 RepID=UPI001C2F7AA4